MLESFIIFLGIVGLFTVFGLLIAFYEKYHLKIEELVKILLHFLFGIWLIIVGVYVFVGIGSRGRSGDSMIGAMGIFVALAGLCFVGVGIVRLKDLSR